MIPDIHKDTFQRLSEAFIIGQVALVACTRADQPAYIIAIAHHDGTDIILEPVAEVLEDFSNVVPPA